MYRPRTDEELAQYGRDQALAARHHLAWTVEQTVNALGISDAFTDSQGDGPFVQSIKREQRESR